MIKTIYAPLPDTINGATVQADADIIIILNSQLTSADKLKAYYHELTHIKLNHITDSRNADELERETDAYTQASLRSLRLKLGITLAQAEADTLIPISQIEYLEEQ